VSLPPCPSTTSWPLPVKVRSSPPAPFKVVETGRSAEDVVALVPGDRVDLGPAEEPVISRPALEEAVPEALVAEVEVRAAGQLVVAAVPVEVAAAFAAVDPVRARASVDGVVPGAPARRSRPRPPTRRSSPGPPQIQSLPPRP
jgi:hypothetical protein